MADDPLRPDLNNPSAHGLEQDTGLERDDDEVVINALKRFGPIVAIFVLIGAIVFGYGAKREQDQALASMEGTRRLREALEGFNDNPSGTRTGLQDLLSEGLYEDLPLKPWVEFLVVRTHIVEGQQAYANDGTPPETALKAVQDYIDSHAQHPEITPLAHLAKASLLEDMGRFNEARNALDQVGIINQDSAAGIFVPFLQQGMLERQRLWDKLRSRHNP